MLLLLLLIFFLIVKLKVLIILKISQFLLAISYFEAPYLVTFYKLENTFDLLLLKNNFFLKNGEIKVNKVLNIIYHLQYLLFLLSVIKSLIFFS